MVEFQSFTTNIQDLATECIGYAILGIIKGELKKLYFSRLKIMAHMIEAIEYSNPNH